MTKETATRNGVTQYFARSHKPRAEFLCDMLDRALNEPRHPTKPFCPVLHFPSGASYIWPSVACTVDWNQMKYKPDSKHCLKRQFKMEKLTINLSGLNFHESISVWSSSLFSLISSSSFFSCTMMAFICGSTNVSSCCSGPDSFGLKLSVWFVF